MMNIVIGVFLVLLMMKVVAELWLSNLNRKEVMAHSREVPEAFRGFIDEGTYRKSVEYTLAKNRAGQIETVYDAVVIGVIIVSGLLPWMFYKLGMVYGWTVWGQAFNLITMGVLLAVPSLPFEWYMQFRLEERFGFNKSSVGLWVSDKLKGLGLMIVIGVPLVWVLLKFFEIFPDRWWIWGFVFLMGFQLLFIVLYPQLIMPLFNKLEPLKEGALRERLMRLAERTGFKASGIEVMDGSKRSGHSNAFFTGFGRFRRIVLFDTLIEQLEGDELEAVLAHEIGHYKKGHVLKMIGVSAVATFFAFWLIAWLVKQEWFFEGFGFEATSGMVPALILFMLLSGLVSFWMMPVINRLSRKHEYEADRFAKEVMGGPESLVKSLRKLSEKNLSNLTPHRAFSAFYYSHPTLYEREKALKG